MTIRLFGPDSLRFQTSSTRVYPLGTELILQDGRQFRWGRNGAATAAKGKLYQSEVPDGNFDTLAIPAATTTYNTAGLRTIRATLPAASIAKNLWKEGYVCIEAAAGAGFGLAYKIESHEASAGSEDLDFTLAPGNALQTTLNTSDKATFMKHPLDAVIIHPAPPTAPVIGVPQVNHVASYYGWFQHRGPCAVLVVGTHVIGGGIVATGTVTGSPDGSVEAAGTIITTTAATIAQITELMGSIIGVCMEVAPTTGYGMVNLDIR